MTTSTMLLSVASLLAGLAAGGVLVWYAQRRRDRSGTSAGDDQMRLRAAEHELELTRATEAERRRIYDDLHDDVGGKLLTLLHQLRDPQQADLARSILQDLRDIVSRSRAVSGSLLEVLALLREESERRLDALGIALDWRQAQALPDPALDDAQAMHLFRIGREAVTNALRHARPQSLRVVLDSVGPELVFEVTDDGQFFEPRRVGSGRGTQTMQARAAELQGDIAWLPGTQGGTKVRLRFPLPPASAAFPDAGVGGTVRR